MGYCTCLLLLHPVWGSTDGIRHEQHAVQECVPPDRKVASCRHLQAGKQGAQCRKSWFKSRLSIIRIHDRFRSCVGCHYVCAAAHMGG